MIISHLFTWNQHIAYETFILQNIVHDLRSILQNIVHDLL